MTAIILVTITHFTLGKHRWICACLPAGLDNAAFTARIFAELQTLVGASGIVGITYLDSGTYHNAPAEFKLVMYMVLRNLRRAA